MQSPSRARPRLIGNTQIDTNATTDSKRTLTSETDYINEGEDVIRFPPITMFDSDNEEEGWEIASEVPPSPVPDDEWSHGRESEAVYSRNTSLE